ncbi:MAG: hypothetical protein ACYTG2_01270 [Planctomycetota bacterium]|jgi:hypothetical protein
MRRGARIMIVVLRSPSRGPGLASSEPRGLPPRDVAEAAAQLMALGAEVRVLDQDTEGLSDRVVRREARLWRADCALLWAGGSLIADNPIPDARPLRSLLAGWPAASAGLAAGPLSLHYGAELLDMLPGLRGALAGPITAELAGGVEAGPVPGLLLRDGECMPAAQGPPAGGRLPAAWQSLPLDACAGRAPGGERVIDVLCGEADASAALQQVRHAVLRAGARRLAFVDRDLGARPEFARALARGMLAAAPGLPWFARVRADHLDPPLAVALFNGGCRELLIATSAEADAPGLPPMDDPARPRIEGAVEACRVLGLFSPVEFVIGRPGHSREMLSAWRRWFADRQMTVHAHVRVLHAGDRGPGEPRLQEAYERAGCWDNTLGPRDVVRAVRELSDRTRLGTGVAGA